MKLFVSVAAFVVMACWSAMATSIEDRADEEAMLHYSHIVKPGSIHRVLDKAAAANKPLNGSDYVKAFKRFNANRRQSVR